MPDCDTKRSPTQVLYARQLKDSLPCHPDKLKLRPEWLLTTELREKALAKRHISIHSKLLSKSKQLKPLQVMDVVQVQNQRGAHANKWDLSGAIVEVQDYDSYLVRMDGTGRLTKRNRRFLRKIIPYTQTKDDQLPLQQHHLSTQTHENESTTGLPYIPSSRR